MPSLPVTLSQQTYAVTIEPDMLARVGECVEQVAPHNRALLAVDANIASTHGQIAADALRAAGYDLATVEITASEAHKTLQAVQRIYSVMLAQRLERSSPVVALGGGVVGDVAGFAAATYLRGVPVVQVPTTLLAMVDAAVGGKTGVNFPLPEGGMGKNLIGAFWQPHAVIADPQVLRTLDVRHLRCGLAESIKHAMIDDPGLLGHIETHAQDILACDIAALTDLITRSVAVKINIVEQDEREAGQRALLNLGHTFAHAIEPRRELDLHHGEAVAIGLCAACRCAVATDRCDATYASQVEALLKTVGLPTKLSSPVDAMSLLQTMMHDKKVASGKLRLILPTGRGTCIIADNVPSELVLQTWRQLGAA